MRGTFLDTDCVFIHLYFYIGPKKEVCLYSVCYFPTHSAYNAQWNSICCRPVLVLLLLTVVALTYTVMNDSYIVVYRLYNYQQICATQVPE